MLVLYSCSNKSQYALSAYKVNYDGLLDTILPAAEIIAEILSEFKEALKEQNTTKFQF